MATPPARNPKMSKAEYQALLRDQATAILDAHGMGRHKGAHKRYGPRGIRSVYRGNGIICGKAAAVAVENDQQSVYVIGGPEHPLKIGIAKSPEKRLKSLQTGCAVSLSIYHISATTNARRVERACHKALSHKRLAGEWFDIDVETAIQVVTREAAKAA